jgi:toxin CptA
MHSAPSVIYPVGRSRLTGLLVLGSAVTGVAAATLAAVQAGSLQWIGVIGLATAILAATWACVRWWRTPAGHLSWDGRGWTWSPDAMSDRNAVPVGLLVCLDLQAVLLLRQPLEWGTSRWFWLERSRFPLRWSALRRAVYSPAVHEAARGILPAPQKS